MAIWQATALVPKVLLPGTMATADVLCAFFNMMDEMSCITLTNDVDM